jgi:cytidylate kinase
MAVNDVDVYGVIRHAVVAVDGPAGSGKSSVSKGVAQTLGLRYLDTGAMYRAITLAVMRSGVALDDIAGVVAVASRARIRSVTDPLDASIWLDDVNVSVEIRSAEVTAAVSAVSAVPEVRRLLVDLQRADVRASVESGSGMVVEGRDIGSVVLPEATAKIYLTADPQVRAQRRAAEIAGAGSAAGSTSGVGPDLSAMQQALAARDAKDSGRATSPLTMAEGAVEVDATHLTLDEVITVVCNLVRDAVTHTMTLGGHDA